MISVTIESPYDDGWARIQYPDREYFLPPGNRTEPYP